MPGLRSSACPLPAAVVCARIADVTRLLALLLPSILLVHADSAAQTKAGEKSHRVLAADASKRRIAIFDAKGKIEWEHPVQSLHDLQLLDSGNILFQTTWTRLVEVTRENEVVWSYDSGERNGNSGKRVEVHAFQRLEDGSTMIAESGPGRIIEVDKQGSMLRQIKLQVVKPHPHRDTPSHHTQSIISDSSSTDSATARTPFRDLRGDENDSCSSTSIA